jgi:DNA-binding beta-propeller fold protein YncE
MALLLGSFVLLSIGAGIYIAVENFFQMTKNVKKLPSFNKYACRTLGDTDKSCSSVEDFRFISDDIIIAGYGNVIAYTDTGNNAPTGKLLAIDLNTEKSRELNLENYPQNVAFRPHGLSFSKKTSRLYVINHANDGEERIEIFTVNHTTSFESVTVTWQDCIHPPVPAGTLNSVTEGSENDIYFTHWLTYAIPPDGNEHPHGFVEHMNVLRNYFYFLGGRLLSLKPLAHGTTYVYRCDLKSKQCTKAAGRFISCNGISATEDGKFVFVVDCSRQTLSVFNRDAATGKLTVQKVFNSPHLCDNVYCYTVSPDKYELWMGSMPDFRATLGTSFNKKSTVLVPGGLLTAEYDGKTGTMTFDDVYIHDGSMLPAVATGAKWKNLVLLSGPRAHGGILVADMSKKN